MYKEFSQRDSVLRGVTMTWGSGIGFAGTSSMTRFSTEAFAKWQSEFWDQLKQNCFPLGESSTFPLLDKDMIAAGFFPAVVTSALQSAGR